MSFTKLTNKKINYSMKKILIILWLVITAGAIFILSHFIKIESKQEEITNTIVRENQELDLSSETKTPEIKIQQTPAFSSDESNKTFTEYLEIGDKYLSENYLNNAIENYISHFQIYQNSNIEYLEKNDFLNSNDDKIWVLCLINIVKDKCNKIKLDPNNKILSEKNIPGMRMVLISKNK